jgi:hypothetical protein
MEFDLFMYMLPRPTSTMIELCRNFAMRARVLIHFEECK